MSRGAYEACTICGKPTIVRVGEVSLPVRHAACHDEWMKTRTQDGNPRPVRQVCASCEFVYGAGHVESPCKHWAMGVR